jgi:hypothetical protein
MADFWGMVTCTHRISRRHPSNLTLAAINLRPLPSNAAEHSSGLAGQPLGCLLKFWLALVPPLISPLVSPPSCPPPFPRLGTSKVTNITTASSPTNLMESPYSLADASGQSLFCDSQLIYAQAGANLQAESSAIERTPPCDDTVVAHARLPTASCGIIIGLARQLMPGCC